MELLRFAVSIATVAAVERLKAATTAVPMGLVAHLDGQANCSKKGIAAAPDQILEIFRPDFAVKVWAADKRAGLDIPIRIHVCAHEGKTWVSCRMPSAVFRPYDNATLENIGAELDEIFLHILAALDDVKE